MALSGHFVGGWGSVIQQDVAGQGFPTPAVRLTAPATSPPGRYLIVMDHTPCPLVIVPTHRSQLTT